MMQRQSQIVCREATGIALVIVLGSLVFLSALVVAFLVQMGTELKSSRLYAEGASARILSQSATNIVMAEIKEATKAADGGARITWASQPGMIRTYDDNGEPYRYFRLYSWNDMSGAGAFDPADPANEISLTGPDAWNKNKAIFTDLNEPVAGSYPIIDGKGIRQLTLSPGNTTVPAYLGYNSDGDSLPDIDGFEVDPAKVDYDPGDPVSHSNHPVPMPVKWLYVLADGRIIAPTGGSGNTATFTAPDQPSATNPIVGRVAFWTDDETCKVNINTASEGIYSDYPRSINPFNPSLHSTSQKENLLAYCQPVSGEYQRYPGHPAVTCLSTIFKYPANWNPPTPKPTGTNLGSAYSTEEWKGLQWSLQLAKIAPRVSNETAAGQPAGSRGASVNTVNIGPNSIGAVSSVSPDPDRLYTHPDELEFRPDLDSLTRSESDTVLSLAGNESIFNKDALKRANFFLTAASRAPDVNLFDLPRVSVWPLHINDTADYRTAFDRLIAFCSTLRSDQGAGAYRFYFQRQDATNQSTDLPDENGASVTGLGRNRMLLEYLRDLTGEKIPGFGGIISAKYSTANGSGGTERDQILTQIFDYIRSTNLSDVSITDPAKRYTKRDPALTAGATAGIAQVVPIVDTKTETRGFGRFPTLQGCSIIFIANIDGDDPVIRWDGTKWVQWDRISPPSAPVWITLDDQETYTSQVNRTTGVPFTPAQALPRNTVRVQALFVPQFFNPAVGSAWFGMNFRWRVTGLNAFSLNGSTLNYPSDTGSQSVAFSSGNPKGEDNAAYGDQLGLAQTMKTNFIKPSITTGLDIKKDQKLQFGGGNLVFTIRDRNDAVVQTIPLYFPEGNFPVPGVAPGRLYNYSKFNAGQLNGTWSGPYNMRYFDLNATDKTLSPETPNTPTVVKGGRVDGGDLTTAAGFFIDRGASVSDASGASLTNPTIVDVVRSVSAAPGDLRLIAGRSQTPDYGAAGYPYEKVNPEFWEKDAGVAGMHTFVTGNQEAYYGTALGRFVELNYENYTALSPAPPNTKGNYPGVFLRGRIPYSNAQFKYPSPGTKGTGYANEHTAAPNIPLNGVAVGKATSFDKDAGDIRGDWDNAPSNLRDGPFINKPDEGDRGTSGTKLPYDWKVRTDQGLISSSLFTPNRQIASAAMFGSLPTGVWANRPWQTLLFRYDPSGKHPGRKDHLGVGDASTGMPADHLLLDLFHMPVVEPYAISEPLSTAGRINMNYQIIPFTYITRSTGIHSVLKSEKLVTIPNARAGIYKTLSGSSQMPNIRTDIDITETLKGFDARFDAGEIFKSASEICELPFVAKGSLYADAATYWDSFLLSGDNSRERPYATVYPRLTTKSNTFTIHVRAQSLKKARGTNADALIWREGRDQVTGEYRGSQTIERFIDPNDPDLPDYAEVPAPAGRPPLGNFYKFRVVSSKQFAP